MPDASIQTENPIRCKFCYRSQPTLEFDETLKFDAQTPPPPLPLRDPVKEPELPFKQQLPRDAFDFAPSLDFKFDGHLPLPFTVKKEPGLKDPKKEIFDDQDFDENVEAIQEPWEYFETFVSENGQQPLQDLDDDGEDLFDNKDAAFTDDGDDQDEYPEDIDFSPAKKARKSENGKRVKKRKAGGAAAGEGDSEKMGPGMRKHKKNVKCGLCPFQAPAELEIGLWFHLNDKANGHTIEDGALTYVFDFRKLSEEAKKDLLEKSLRNKVENKDGAPGVRCIFCAKHFDNKFDSDADLKRHYLQWHWPDSLPLEKKRRCRLCGIEIHASVKMFKKHRKECIITQGLLKCQFCSHVTKTELRLSVHIEMVHRDILANGGKPGEKKKGQPTTSIDQETFEKDPRINLEERKCLDCNRDFDRVSGLKRHMEMVHYAVAATIPRQGPKQEFFSKTIQQELEDDPEVDFPTLSCKICGPHKTYSTQKGLHSHMAAHRDEMKLRCKFCGKGFNESGNYVAHLKANHLGHGDDHEQAMCNICGKGFPSETHLKAHLLRHNKVRYECDICGKDYSDSAYLTYHKKRDHFKTVPTATCEHCGKVFISLARKNAHIKKVHITTRTFKCHLCPNDYKCSSHLNRHLRLHHNIQFEKKILSEF